MKLPKSLLPIFACLLFLGGCDPNGLIKPTQTEIVKEKTEIKKVKTASAGKIIYQERRLNTHPALQLHHGVNIKHSSFFAPRLHLRKGQLLVRSLENRKYEYYAIQKNTENLREFLLETMTVNQSKRIANVQGIRRDKQTGKLDGFVISSDREYAYDLPKDMSWENTSAYPSRTKNNESKIRFLGIKNNEIIFSHYDFLHKPKRFGKDKHYAINKQISVPKNTKKVTIDHHVIEIIKATPKTIKYKIVS